MRDGTRAQHHRSSVGTFLRRSAVQGRVVHALILRELMTRFGRSNLGFFWLMGEPLILMGAVALIWSATKGPAMHDVSVLAIVLTGYTMLTLWRHIVTRAIHCIRQNAGLLYHRNVRVIDAFIARWILESVGTGLTFVIAYVPLYVFGLLDGIADPRLLGAGWAFMSWIAGGIALMLAGLSEVSDIAERMIQPAMYVILPFTGAFYLVDWLPEGLRAVVVYSPLVHASEMFRAGLLGPAVPTHWHVGYLTCLALALNALGLLVVARIAERATLHD